MKAEDLDPEFRGVKAVGINLVDGPEDPSVGVYALHLGPERCDCGEELKDGWWLTWCPRYRKVGDNHVLRGRPPVIDQTGKKVLA